MSNVVIPVVALSIGVIASITDVRTKRIPNALTFGAALAAVLFHAGQSGLAGLQTAVLGWIVGTALFLPFFLLRGMGAGDVKLLAALGAWFGPEAVLWLALYSSIAGGVMAVIVGLQHGYLREAFTNIKALLTSWYLVGPSASPTLTLEHAKGPRLAYAVPVLAGTMVTVWLQ